MSDRTIKTCSHVNKRQLFFSPGKPFKCSSCELFVYVKSPVLGALSVIFGLLALVGSTLVTLMYSVYLGVIYFFLVVGFMIFVRYIEILLVTPVCESSKQKNEREKKEGVIFLIILLAIFGLVILSDFF